MSALLHHLQRMLMRDLELTLAQVKPEDDGEIAVVGDEGVVLYARLFGDQVWARLWAVAARNLKPSAKLLREVNEHNQALCGARAFLHDGQLVVVGEMPAASLEPGDLRLLADEIVSCALEVGSLVQVVYGGTAPSSADAPRAADTS